jgi:serine protease Do
MSSSMPGGPEEGSAGSGPDASASRPGSRQGRRWTTAIVVTGAAAAVVAGILLLNTIVRGSTPTPPTGSQPTTSAWTLGAWGSGGLPAAARPAGRSMVRLDVSTPGGPVTGCGVVVAEGGLVAASATTVQGATAIAAVTAAGRHERATVVAVDAGSGIALLRVSGSLPVPNFDDNATHVAVGSGVLVLSLADGTSGPVPDWSVSSVSAVAAPVVSGAGSGMTAVVVGATHFPLAGGDVLIEPDGAVAGFYDPGATSSTAGAVFLPMGLVEGVATELAGTGSVRRGWLDITLSSGSPIRGQSGATGALVEQVMASGPAAGALHVGDLIVAVDGVPVRSLAQVRTLLYVMPPGTPVRLAIVRGATRTTVDVNLAASP